MFESLISSTRAVALLSLALLLQCLAPAPAACEVEPFVEVQELLASDRAAGDHFGVALAFDGETLAVGALFDDHSGLTDAGSVYIFRRSRGHWVETAKLTASDRASGDHFGISLALNGSTLVVGATGHQHSGASSGIVYVFTESGGTWQEEARLMANDAAADDSFGRWVAIDGDTIAVTARNDDYSGLDQAGSAYVFVRDGSGWVQQQKITPSDPQNQGRFGVYTDVDGDELVVAASLKNTEYGSVYVFEREAGIWSQRHKIYASDRQHYDEFGARMVLAGDLMVATAIEDDHSGIHDAGSAYILEHQGDQWVERQKLIAADSWTDAWFGAAAGLDGDTLVLTATSARSSSRTGAAFVFRRSGDSWLEEQTLVGSDLAIGDRFGGHTAPPADDTLPIGARYHSHEGVNECGSVYVFAVPTTAAPPACGDGNLDRGESCDDGNRVAGDGCRADCTLEQCSDGILDLDEACDDGNLVAGDGCRADCTLERCGDGALDPAEACDDGNLLEGDGCRGDCTVEQCGDGIVDTGEACDDGNLFDGDGCRGDCTVEQCGDGIVDPGEACDDANRVDHDGCRNDCSLPRVGPERSHIVAVPNVDGLGNYGVGVLLTGSIEVALREAATGAPVRELHFSTRSGAEALVLASVPDLDGNKASELAVLAQKVSGRGLVYVRDCLTGRRLSRWKLAEELEPIDLEIVENLAGRGPGLVVLALDEDGRAVVVASQAWGRKRTTEVLFPTDFAPLDIETAEYLGEVSVTLLSRSESSGEVRVITKDLATGRTVGDWSVEEVFFPLDLEVVPETTANGSRVVAVLGELPDGGGRLFLHLLESGERVKTTRLASGYRDLALELVPRVNAAGASGLAVLQMSTETGLIRVDTRRALARRRIGVARFADLLSVAGITVVGNLAASPSDEISLVGESRCAEGNVAVTLRDPANGLLVQCFPVP